MEKSLIDFDFSNNNEPQKGSVLISEPFLSDDYFSRSVIYLCEHNDEGSFGFVLNKYVDTNLSDVIEGFPSIDFKVSVGGPVDTSNLFYLHTLGDTLDRSIEIARGVCLGGDFEQMKTIVSNIPGKAKDVRFFIGYSGWSAGQLQEELNEKSWIVLNNISSQVILDTENDEIWKNLMERLGGKFKVMSKFPVNPSDN